MSSGEGSTNKNFKEMGQSRRDRRLKHLLLEPRFQLKYTSMIVGMATVICAALGAFLISKVRENSRMLALDEAFQAELAAQDAAVIAGLIFGFAVFLFVLFMLSIYVTHRMAGPIFVMRRYLRELARGGLPKIRGLRKGDEFTDLLDDFVMTVDSLEERMTNEIAVLQKVHGALEGAGGERQMLEDLARMIEEKADAVERRRMPDTPPGRGSSFFGPA